MDDQPPLIIELLGAPCSGKSTILRALRERRQPGAPWVTGKEVLSAPLPRTKSPLSLYFALKARWQGRLQPHLLADADVRFVKRHPSLVSHLFAAVHDSHQAGDEDAEMPMIRLKKFLQAFAKEQAMLESRVAPVVIADETIAKFLSFMLRHESQRDRLGAILLSPGMPSGYVVVASSPQATARRASSRKKIAGVHLNKSFEELVEYSANSNASWQILADSAEAFGIPVLRLDGEDDPAANARQTVDFAGHVRERSISGADCRSGAPCTGNEEKEVVPVQT